MRLFYEMKSNLRLDQVKGLVDGGIRSVQPGIESLSTPVLRRMRKGVLARQNVALLRYARICGLGVKWNILYGFPGDDAGDHAPMLELMPKLAHLPPPLAVGKITIQRFSDFFERPDDYGLADIQPYPSYHDVFPPHAALDQLAYHLEASYPSGSVAAAELIDALVQASRRWWKGWTAGSDRAPALAVTRVAPGSYALVDTRGLGGGPLLYLNESQAAAVLVGGPLERVPLARWAIHNAYAVELDGWCVPLATAPYSLLFELERRYSVSRSGTTTSSTSIPAATSKNSPSTM